MPNMYVYTFRTPTGRLMLFGPYETEHTAAAAFRRQFNIWPRPAELRSRWVEVPADVDA